MGKLILDVDLGKKSYSKKSIDDSLIDDYIGGKGLATKILYDGMNPKSDPLSEDNLLIVMSGALNPYVPKFVVVSKSPLTDTICTSCCGGSFGSMLKKAGYEGMILRGKADNLTYLSIEDDKIEFYNAESLKNFTISKTTDNIPKSYSYLVIGPAGENLVRYASICSDGRFVGRGGLGAVMGSKNVKAIGINGTSKVESTKDFRESLAKMNQYVKKHKRTFGLREYGTSNLVLPGSMLGYTPVDNYGSEGDVEDFEKISGEELAKYNHKNSSCKSCSINCGKDIKLDSGVFKKPEYESIALLGPNLGNYDLENIVELSNLCDNLGLDTMSTGGVLGWGMQSGNYNLLKFGRNDNLKDMIYDIAYKMNTRGKKLGMGVKRLSEEFGGKDYAIHVKGMEMPAYVPSNKTLAQTLAYLTSSRGACHMSSPTAVDELTGYAPLTEGDAKGKPELVIFMEDLDAAMDSLGMCRFSAYALVEKRIKIPEKIEKFFFGLTPQLCLDFSMDISSYPKILSEYSGKKYSSKDFLKVGKRIIALERDFNKQAGVSESVLPRKVKDNIDSEILDKLLEDYEKIRNKEKV